MNNIIKRYPIEKYIEFANNLKKEKAIFILGPDEEELENILIKHEQEIIKGNLDTIAAILAKCKYVIQSDSGIGHLSSAVGTITKTIVGSTNWPRTAPFGNKNKLIKYLDLLQNGLFPFITALFLWRVLLKKGQKFLSLCLCRIPERDKPCFVSEHFRK